MKIPRPTELVPELATLLKKQSDLSTKFGPLREERLSILDALREGNVDEESPLSPQVARVADLLGRDRPRSATTLKERLRDIDNRLADGDAALNVVGGEIKAAFGRASSKARAMMEGEYRKRVKAVVESLISIHHANYALREFVELFEEAGFGSAEWRQSLPDIVGGHTDPNSKLSYALRGYAEAGFIRPSEIPGALRHA